MAFGISGDRHHMYLVELQSISVFDYSLPVNTLRTMVGLPKRSNDQGVKMVSAISRSATGSLFSSASTTSSSSDDAAKIQAQIAAKKAELADTKDPDEAETLQKDLAALETKLTKLEKSANGQSSAAGQSAKSGTASNFSSESGSSKSKPQSSLSGESDRIGATNFDGDTAFGDRTAYV